MFGQIQREAFGGDPIALGIVTRGFQGLEVDIGAHGLFGTQQQGGDGQDAGTAAKVQHFAVFQVLAVQPFQAQGGGRVGAGAERQARVEQQVDCVRLGGGVPARHDPQALAEAHGLEVVHPAAFPVLVFDDLAVMFRQRAASQQFQVGQDACSLGATFEQGQQMGV
ncbi:hypothetical protein D3C85_760890 [compost metagenome]